MLATLNDKNDPHDAIEISPDIVLASRADKDAPPLAPEIARRPEPKIEAAPNIVGTPPSVDAAVRAALSDFKASRKRSSIGKWLGGALFSMVFAMGSAAAAIAWQMHGDMVMDKVAQWIPALTAAPSQATQAAADQPAPVAPQPQADQAAAQPAASAPQPDSTTPQQDGTAAPTAAIAPDTAQSLQSMAHDLATMGQQIEQLKTNIAELKASQEQMARELAKPQSKPAEARAAQPRTRTSALPARPPVTRRPRPVYPPASTSSYAHPPVPIAPPVQAAAVPPPPAPQQTADDDGPVVRPPMPVR